MRRFVVVRELVQAKKPAISRKLHTLLGKFLRAEQNNYEPAWRVRTGTTNRSSSADATSPPPQTFVWEYGLEP